jgi:uracil-DNA glycosylase
MHCLLPTAYCLLPTAYCLLPTARCLLPAACYLLPTASCYHHHVDQLADHLRYFQDLGVDGISRNRMWRVREEVPRSGAEPADEPTAVPIEATGIPVVVSRSAAEALKALRDEIGDCTRCKLHTLGRQQVVFGVGDPNAEIMFVGEGPGADEDEQGIPFVGRAGQLLTKMIEAGMGLRRDEVYIANVVKCRPPGNRNPEPDEIATCELFLFRQIEAVQPKVIVALGKFAAQTLLKVDTPIGRLRGRQYDYRGTTLIPTFHPSFLLRSPGFKREAWDDLKLALKVLGREAPPAASRS